MSSAATGKLVYPDKKAVGPEISLAAPPKPYVPPTGFAPPAYAAGSAGANNAFFNASQDAMNQHAYAPPGVTLPSSTITLPSFSGVSGPPPVVTPGVAMTANPSSATNANGDRLTYDSITGTLK